VTGSPGAAAVAEPAWDRAAGRDRGHRRLRGGLARFLTAAGVEIVEVDRPNRQLRRRRGKSDPEDAEAAARAAPTGEATGVPQDPIGQRGSDSRAARCTTISARLADFTAAAAGDKPPAARLRCLLRPSLRRQPDPSLIRTEPTPSPQPRRRPRHQPGPVAHRPRAHVHLRPHPHRRHPPNHPKIAPRRRSPAASSATSPESSTPSCLTSWVPEPSAAPTSTSAPRSTATPPRHSSAMTAGRRSTDRLLHHEGGEEHPDDLGVVVRGPDVGRQIVAYGRLRARLP